MSSEESQTETKAQYGRCVLCNTPFETNTERTGENSWRIEKTCPNTECDHV